MNYVIKFTDNTYSIVEIKSLSIKKAQKLFGKIITEKIIDDSGFSGVLTFELVELSIV
jgi:hypothetical protein